MWLQWPFVRAIGIIAAVGILVSALLGLLATQLDLTALIIWIYRWDCLHVPAYAKIRPLSSILGRLRVLREEYCFTCRGFHLQWECPGPARTHVDELLAQAVDLLIRAPVGPTTGEDGSRWTEKRSGLIDATVAHDKAQAKLEEP